MPLLLLLLLFADDPPLVGRPAEFTGAAGPRVRVSLSAAPTTLVAEEPLTLTLHISGATDPAKLTRPDLRRRREFADDFQIEDGPERTSAAGREFDYRLRPRRAGIREIPVLKFVYYRPGVGYQTTYAGDAANGDALALTVTAKPPPPESNEPSSGPDWLFELPSAVELRQRPRWNPIVLAIVLLCLWLVGVMIWLSRTAPRADDSRRRAKLVRRSLRQVSAATNAAGLADAVGRHWRAFFGPGHDNREVVALLRRCEELQYGPGGSTDLTALRDEALAVLQRAEGEA